MFTFTSTNIRLRKYTKEVQEAHQRAIAEKRKAWDEQLAERRAKLHQQMEVL